MNGKWLPKALTIAGSDSGGGAGIQADLKTFEAFGVFGATAITAVTAQNTCGVLDVLLLPPLTVGSQIDAVMNDIRPAAIKTGMLGSAGIIEMMAGKMEEYAVDNLVVDPVMVSTSGDRLLDRGAVGVLKDRLLPASLVVTPNLEEAEVLAGFPITDRGDMEEAARVIRGLGPRYVVIKGGHRSDDADDLLFDGEEMRFLKSPRLTDRKLHGAGCTFSAAITAGLARGSDPVRAITDAKLYMTRALKNPSHPGGGAYTVNWSASEV